MRCVTQALIPIMQILQCRAPKRKVLLISYGTLQQLAQCIEYVGAWPRSQHAVSLGSLWQPILKRSKRYMRTKTSSRQVQLPQDRQLPREPKLHLTAERKGIVRQEGTAQAV